MGVLIVVGVLVVFPLIFVIATYNSLVALHNHIREAWADIDAELKRRYDLIPNLVETVKGFAASGGASGNLEVILPGAQRAKLEGAIVADMLSQAGTSVSVRFEDGFSFGFRLSPEGSGYLFDFSDEGFREIYLKFLAPRFREYFFSK